MLVCLIAAIACGTTGEMGPAKAGNPLPNPIMFVTQVPIPADFTTIGSTFGNHLPAMDSVGRGGDLMILYPNGTLKNLTQAAGYGMVGHQGSGAIAVRDPHIHWDGQKAIFSMVIGAPTQFNYLDYQWQLYEITGLGENDTPVISKVPNQPETTNNIQPVYASDDRIIFTSDRPHQGREHLYPLLDEYEEAATVTGLWSLNPATGDLFQINHAPSGSFTPIIDSFGRVVFTRWDHLQRDQQADADATSANPIYGTFNYADESPGAAALDVRDEVFPEPRSQRTDLLAGTNLEGHNINLFLPWQINQDGSEEETLNHVGRHELSSYFNRSMNDDANLDEFIDVASGRLNQNAIDNFFHIREDPSQPGRYFGIDAPEFSTHCSGQIIAVTAPADGNADLMEISYVTHRDTAGYTSNPSPEHTGHYREPLVLSDGTILAVHTAETRADANEGSRAFPQSRYDFRIKHIELNGAYYEATTAITSGTNASITYYDPDVLVTYNGPLWELTPVEVVARTRPVAPEPVLPSPETQVFNEEQVDIEAFRQWMAERRLSLVVSRDLTTRDGHDKQQPYNIRVAGTATSTIPVSGTIYDIATIQFFQADHIRGIGGSQNPSPGRRVLAQPMHDDAVDNPASSGPQGSVDVADDGSMAAFVPARRAMAWQTLAPDDTPVVRERYWVTFQPGEIRVCTSCHGLNTSDQMGQPDPQNPPDALRLLLQHWKQSVCGAQPTDINASGQTDILDAVLVASAVGSGPGPMDLTCDQAVDLADILVVVGEWLNAL